MTRDDIIRMAREAEGEQRDHGWWAMHIEDLERFAALVSLYEVEKMVLNGWRQCAVGQRTTQFCGATEAAIREEREACAKVCDQMDHDGVMVAAHCAAEIRARGSNCDQSATS